jgi:hypothetical protein
MASPTNRVWFASELGQRAAHRRGPASSSARWRREYLPSIAAPREEGQQLHSSRRPSGRPRHQTRPPGDEALVRWTTLEEPELVIAREPRRFRLRWGPLWRAGQAIHARFSRLTVRLYTATVTQGEVLDGARRCMPKFP